VGEQQLAQFGGRGRRGGHRGVFLGFLIIVAGRRFLIGVSPALCPRRNAQAARP
jgi:hypothetical protein